MHNKPGRPIYYYPMNGAVYGNCGKKNIWGFDIKGMGGYVVAPRSVHPDTGKEYVVLHDRPVVACPQWILDFAKREKNNSVASAAADVDLASLPVSEDVKNQILDLRPRPTRSEGIWYVLCSLLEAGVSREIIHCIFERYSVGEKYREQGRKRVSWLDGEIDRALAHIKTSLVPVSSSGKSSHDLLEYIWMDENGDGLLFSEIFKNQFCYDRSENEWYRFFGHVWMRDRVNQVFREIDCIAEIYSEAARDYFNKRMKVLKENEEVKIAEKQKLLMKRIQQLHKVKRRNNILIAASSGAGSLGISGDEWDRNNWLIACKNGILDLRMGTLRAGTPGDYIRRQINTEWMGLNAPSPIFDQFLNDIFISDTELIGFLFRLLGYALMGTSKEHILVMLYGKGRNGKDTLMEVIHHVLGDLAWPVQSELLLSSACARSSSNPSPDILDLRGRRIVWCSEAEEGRRFNSAKVKWLVGGGSLVGRGVFAKHNENFLPSHTMFFLTNSKPRVVVNDYAFWQRVILIQFPVSFVDNPVGPNEILKDKNILEKMKGEGPGILSKIVRGGVEWQEKGLQIPESVRLATNEYKNSEDSIKQFIDECCYLGDEKQIGAKTFYDAYRSWCDSYGIDYVNQRIFAGYVGERFKKSNRQGGGYHYKGVDLDSTT